MRTEFKNHENHASDIVFPALECAPVKDKNGISALREQFENLTECFLKDSDPELLTTQSGILDSYFQDSFAESNTGIELDPINNPYAIIARGNYGRKEICSQPKVTILFIFSTSIPEKADGLIKDIIYPLWDLNLNITYSIRTVKECIADAKKDYTYLLSVLDSRFVCGASQLFYQLTNTIREKIVFSKKKEIAALQYELDKKRQEEYGSPDFLLEPDLIHSEGGLKDLDSILSIARSNLNLFDQVELKQSKIISKKDYETLVTSIEYIRKVVRFLSITSKRSSRLLVKHQHTAAKFMKYKATKTDTAEDLFLSDLCRHMNNVRKIHYKFFLFASPRSFIIKKNTKTAKLNTPDWLFKAKGLISFKSTKKIREKPLRLLEIFIESEKHGMLLNAEALRLINDNQHLLHRPDIEIKKAGEFLEQSLFSSDINSETPLTLLDSGILTTLIPELKYAVNKKTAGYYHYNPLCHHLLLTINHLKELLRGKESIKPGSVNAVFSPSCHYSIFWAALLQGLDSDVIRSILSRFEKSPDIIDNVCFLTNNYNFLYSIISHENIFAEKTIRHYSTKAGSYRNLNMLYFLTIADMKAKGSLACSAYKLEDLERLYHSVIESLFDKKSRSDKSLLQAETLLELCRFYRIKNAETILSDIDLKNYHNTFSQDALLLHLKLISETGQGELTTFTEKTGELRKTTILSKNENFSLQDILGILLENNINIYDYRYHSFTESTAVHAFRAEKHQDIVFENEKWAKVKARLQDKKEHNLHSVFKRSATFTDKDTPLSVYPSSVKVTKSPEEAAYLIEIVSDDSPETLYSLVNEQSTSGFGIVFFRKTIESCGCLYIFKIIDPSGKLDGAESRKRFTDKLLRMMTNEK